MIANYLIIKFDPLFVALQFGFITIFVAACPLAPLFALINNWVEVRLDAKKFISDFRRPVVEKAHGIGVWKDILHIIAHLAVISNVSFLSISFLSIIIDQLID